MVSVMRLQAVSEYLASERAGNQRARASTYILREVLEMELGIRGARARSSWVGGWQRRRWVGEEKE
jgi:hypothetical protein